MNGNTDLKGGVISSTADGDKNKLETGTLTWSDVQTKSEWETSTKGFGATLGSGIQGEAGSGPLIKPSLKDGDSDSGSAKAAISNGQITITKPNEQNQNIADLNRDTSNSNDVIKALPDLQQSLNEQLKTQQEWSEAAQNMATAVRDLSNELAKNNPAFEDGKPDRAALHAIAGGLLGGVNGVDGAIKAAIGAGVSTIIAPYIKQIVDQAVAQSGLKGANAKRVSDSLTSSIVLGLIGGAGGTDATAYASNEIKYNYLRAKDRKLYLETEQCLLGQLACDLTQDEYDAIMAHLRQTSEENTDLMMEVCNQGPSEACSEMIKEAREDNDWWGYINTLFGSFRIKSNKFSKREGDSSFPPAYDSIAVSIYEQGLYGDEARKAIASELLKYDSRRQMFEGFIEFSGVSVCKTFGRVACFAAALGAGFGLNRIAKGVHQIVTDEKQISLVEQALIKMGATKEEAKTYLSRAEITTGIVFIGDSAYKLLRQGGTLASITKLNKGSSTAAKTENAVAHAGEQGANNVNNALKLKTVLAMEEAGLIERTDKGIALTEKALINPERIMEGSDLRNPRVIAELTSDGSNINDWGKYTTKSFKLSSGKRGQIHFYYNPKTNTVNYNIDFKVKSAPFNVLD